MTPVSQPRVCKRIRTVAALPIGPAAPNTVETTASTNTRSNFLSMALKPSDDTEVS